MDIAAFIQSPQVAGQIRHLMTGAAGVLVGAGAIQQGQSASFVDIGTGIAVYGLAAIWSWWQKSGQKEMADELALLKARRPMSGLAGSVSADQAAKIAHTQAVIDAKTKS